MYNPCHTCANRFGHGYTKDCDDNCDYAQSVKLNEAVSEFIGRAHQNEEELEKALKAIKQTPHLIPITEKKYAEHSSKVVPHRTTTTVRSKRHDGNTDVWSNTPDVWVEVQG